MTLRRPVEMQPSVRSAASALTVASREAPHQLASCSWDSGNSTSIPSVVSSPKRSASSCSRHATLPSVSSAANSSRLRSASRSRLASTRRSSIAVAASVSARVSADPGATVASTSPAASAVADQGRAVQRRQIANHVARPGQPEEDLAPARSDARDRHPAALDHEHAVGQVTLREQRLAAAKSDAAAFDAQRGGQPLVALSGDGHRHSVPQSNGRRELSSTTQTRWVQRPGPSPTLVRPFPRQRSHRPPAITNEPICPSQRPPINACPPGADRSPDLGTCSRAIATRHSGRASGGALPGRGAMA